MEKLMQTATILPLPLPRARAFEVERVNHAMLDLATAMKTIAIARGQNAITAPELGILLRIVVVVDGSWTMKLFNPVIAQETDDKVEVYGLGPGNGATRLVTSGRRAKLIAQAIARLG